MPDKPTYDQIAEYAAKLTDKSKEQYGFCQRGKPGWGENMAFVGPMVNAFGGRWFDVEWKPQLTSEPWKNAVSYYVKNMNEYGPPGATSNGHNENRALFATGHCAMWVDATSAAGYIFNPEGEPGRRQDLVRAGADRGDQQRLGLVLGLGAGHPELLEEGRRRQVVREMGDLQGIHHASSATRSAGSRHLPARASRPTTIPKYQEAAPFAKVVYDAVASADITKPTKDPVPYIGIQYVAIPEFQGIGTTVGQQVAAALAGQVTVDAGAGRRPRGPPSGR